MIAPYRLVGSVFQFYRSFPYIVDKNSTTTAVNLATSAVILLLISCRERLEPGITCHFSFFLFSYFMVFEHQN